VQGDVVALHDALGVSITCGVVAGAVDHSGKPVRNLPMVINLGIAQILEGKA
jgi:hypothetical protein